MLLMCCWCYYSCKLFENWGFRFPGFELRNSELRNPAAHEQGTHNNN